MDKQVNEDMGNGWTRRWIRGTFPIHRAGWRGAWDAVVAALLGEPRHTVPTELTFSVYTKGSDDVLLTWGGQLETDQRVGRR